MKIEFKRLSEVGLSEIVELMTEPRLRAHMPLLREHFDVESVRQMAADKEQAWADHRFAAWAFFVDRRFVGWGGLQWEEGEPDLGLVLHPDAWGLGKALYDEIARRAFEEFGFDHVMVLLPPTRRRLPHLSVWGSSAARRSTHTARHSCAFP
jgi:ribosomal-protein-alanine N-acetyltransferase